MHIAITGVSRGLGRALVPHFAQQHEVSGCARTESALGDLHAALDESIVSRVHLMTADVGSDESVANWASHVLETSGPPDLLINNAAIINENATLWNVDEADFVRLMDINVNGVARVIRHFVPAMIERGSGIIVNLSSGWGRSTSPEVGPYCASKWAIEGLSKALADELPAGMACVPVNPGIINTEMLRSCFGSGATGFPTADRWAHDAARFFLNLSPSDNGDSLTVG